MRILDFFRKTSPAQPLGQTHIMVPALREPSLIKSGKWVYHTRLNLPGILLAAKAFPQLDVMLVNSEGENYQAVQAAISEIRIARLLEIPEKRRPSPEIGASLGYF
jgi:hypothetical protein